jgi:phage terminase small subunit
VSATLNRFHRPRKTKDSIKPKVEKALATGSIQEVIDSLTIRQRRFVEEYLIDFNGTQACLRAGYTGKHVNRQAFQNMEHPGIRAAIDFMVAQRASESAIKPDYVIKKVTKAIETAEQEGNHSAVLKGCELLARHLGMFIERQEISGPNGDPIRVEQVKEAADAFTSAINSLIERNGEGPTPFEIVAGDEG